MPGTQLPRLGITRREGCLVTIGIAQDEWKFDMRYGEAPPVESSTGGVQALLPEASLAFASPGSLSKAQGPTTQSDGLCLAAEMTSGEGS
jgi:hypothetical protein